MEICALKIVCYTKYNNSKKETQCPRCTCTGVAAFRAPATMPPMTRPSGAARQMLRLPNLCRPPSVDRKLPDRERMSKLPCKQAGALEHLRALEQLGPLLLKAGPRTMEGLLLLCWSEGRSIWTVQLQAGPETNRAAKTMSNFHSMGAHASEKGLKRRQRIC
jgi:hypothetical protein